MIVGIVLVILIGLGVASAGFYMGYHNQFVALEETIDGQWAQVENQLQRRADLVPNLVATVKGYAAHESEVFTAIAEARSRLAGAGSPKEKLEASSQLDSALSRLLVVVERYPDLKASEQFLTLQNQLEGTENRLTVARTRYNEAIKTFNTAIRRFPGNVIAGMMNLAPKEYFEAAPSAKAAPKAEF